MSNPLPEIVIPCPITQSFIRAHPEWIFVYGMDVAGNGALGQVVVCAGELNCFPVYTRWKGCKSNGYFQDSQIAQIQDANNLLISLISTLSLNKVIIPFPKIGRGASRMFELAPISYKWLMAELDEIKYKNIHYTYNGIK